MLPPGMDEAGQRIIEALAGIDMPLRDVIKAVKWQYIETALRKHNYHFQETARALGMHRNTFSRTLQELDMREHVEKLYAQAHGGKRL